MEEDWNNKNNNSSDEDDEATKEIQQNKTITHSMILDSQMIFLNNCHLAASLIAHS